MDHQRHPGALLSTFAVLLVGLSACSGDRIGGEMGSVGGTSSLGSGGGLPFTGESGASRGGGSSILGGGASGSAGAATIPIEPCTFMAYTCEAPDFGKSCLRNGARCTCVELLSPTGLWTCENPVVSEPPFETPFGPYCQGAPSGRPLTAAQYLNVVRRFIPGAVSHRDAIGLTTEELRFFTLERAAEALLPRETASTLADVASSQTEVTACAGSVGTTCVAELIASYGEQAFRRPTTSEERSQLLQVFENDVGVNGRLGALKSVIAALLTAPQFLYRSETGVSASNGMAVLTPFERAESLAFFITDAPPDSELYEAAKNDQLDATALGQHAVRLAQPGAAGLRTFFANWLGYPKVLEREKDPSTFPAYTPSAREGLLEETQAFIEHVLWQDGAKLATLLTANYSLLNEPVAALYGLPRVTGQNFRKVVFPSTEPRSGLLTQGSLLAALTGWSGSRITHRGIHLRRKWLCQPVPFPPSNTIPFLPEGFATQRQAHEEIARMASCGPGPCHGLFDPPGFTLERYDDVGRYRTTENDQLIDPSATIIMVDGASLQVKDAIDLGLKLAASNQVSECFSSQLMAHAVGGSPCVQTPVVQKFRLSGTNVLDLVRFIAESEAFVTRLVLP
jgi:hypothetical protein